MTNLNIEQLFEEHFYKVDNKGANKTYVNMEIRINGTSKYDTPEQIDIFKHFNSIVRKFSTSLEFYDKQDMLQTYSSLFYLASTDLEVLEDIETLKADKELYKSRLSYIKTRITHEFKEYANPHSIKVNVDNETKYITPEIQSLNVAVGDSDGNVSELGNLLSEDTNIFSSNQESHHNHFVQWFLDNKDTVLTKKQLEFYETFKDIYVPRVDNTKESNEQRAQMLEDAGISKRMMNNYFGYIKKRVTEKYEEEFGGIYHSHISQNNMKLDNLLNEYVKLADSSWETQVERQDGLAELLSSAFDNYEFEKIAVQGMKKEEKRNVVGGIQDAFIEDDNKRRIEHRLLRIIKQNIIKYKKEHNIKDSDIEASKVEFEYTEKAFSNLKSLADTNLTITPAGMVIAREDVTEKLA